jgi:hypothetical protein
MTDPIDLALQLRATMPASDGVLTTVMNDLDSRVGAYIAALVPPRKPRPQLVFPASQWPELVAVDPEHPLDRPTIGGAFGWWLRLTVDSSPRFDEAIGGARRARPAVAAAFLELLGDIRQNPRFRPQERTLRMAVVLTWFEQIYRNPLLAVGSPVAALADSDGYEALLALVPEHVLEQLRSLCVVAEERLLPSLAEWGDAVFPRKLDRGGVFAEADLVANSTIIEVKVTQGVLRGGALEFRPDIKLLRQLIGYALLDVDDTLGASGVGVYAARFGLLKTWNFEELVGQLSSVDSGLGRLREGFALLLD